MTPDAASTNPRYLLIGASGAVGQRVLARLAAGADAVIALSRQPQTPGSARVHWLPFDLYRDDPNTLPQVASVIAAGPLDGLALCAAKAPWRAGTRLVALSSLSAETKAGSSNADERALAQRLRDAEATLLALGAARGWAVTLIRASVIYDPQFAYLSLDRLTALARRLHWLPLPRDATGLRQPVHADDLAQALLACVAGDTTAGAVLRLAGGEVVAFDAMIERYFRAQACTARIIRLPRLLGCVLQAVLAIAGARGRAIASQLARSRTSLAIGAGDWARVGRVPRAFMQPESTAD